LGALIALVFGVPSPVHAVEADMSTLNRIKAAHLDRLKTKHTCPLCFLSHVDLRNANLSKVNFRRTYFLQANLSGANLSGANMSETVLFEADLSKTNLSGAKLFGAYLWGANLSGANLSGAVLWGAVFYKANLTGVNMTGALMKETNLDGAILCRTKMPSGREDNSGCK